MTDTGVGMSETPAGGIGPGARLIAGLAQQSGGQTVVTGAYGVRIERRFPLAVPAKAEG